MSNSIGRFDYQYLVPQLYAKLANVMENGINKFIYIVTVYTKEMLCCYNWKLCAIEEVTTLKLDYNWFVGQSAGIYRRECLQK